MATSRRPWTTDALLVLIGAAVLVLSALWVDEHTVSGAERSVFEAVNGLPSGLYEPLWVFMQLGNFLVIPAAALLAVLFRRYRLAIGLLVGGVLTYFAAKLVKRVVVRGRPSTLLDDVHVHGDPSFGLGFVSGHAAVIAALVTIAWPWLNRPARIVVFILAALVGFGRVYVGAHFPLDVVGGVGLGVAVGGVVRLVIGGARREERVAHTD